MHVLTLVVSFTYSIPRFHWARVLVELLEVAVHRRGCQATVLFREYLYDADLMTAFAEHVSRWRHVMSDISHYANGYRAPSTTAPESWSDDDDDDADDAADDDDGVADDYDADDPATADDDAASVAFRAAFRAHMTNWEPVMHQLLLLHVPSPTPVFRRLHRGPVHYPSLFRRRRSVSLRIALARKMTARCVRRSLLTSFNTAS